MAFFPPQTQQLLRNAELPPVPQLTPLDLRPRPEQDALGHRILSASCTARQMAAFRGKQVTMYGYLVTIKSIRTVRGERMNFGCFYDYEGFFIDTIHFPPSLERYPFRGQGVYCLKGKVVDEFGFLSLEVSQMHKLPRKPDPRASPP